MIGLIILFYYSINYSAESKGQLDDLFYQGELASDLLLSEEVFGILSEGKINQTKLDTFDALSNSGKKGSLGVHDNFYFTMDNMKIGGNPKGEVGIVNTTSVDNLVQITRLTIYENKITKLKVFVWS